MIDLDVFISLCRLKYEVKLAYEAVLTFGWIICAD